MIAFQIIESLAALAVLVKGIIKYKKLNQIYSKLKSISLTNVSKVHQLLKNKKPLEKIYVAIKGKIYGIKGIAKAHPKSIQNDILSIVQTKPLRLRPLILNSLQKTDWSTILEKAEWKRPRELTNLKFNLKDLSTQKIVQISKCENTNLSGALSQFLSQTVIHPQHKHSIINVLKDVLRFFTSIFPLNYFLPRLTFGNEIKYYGIQNDQFLVAIGEVMKNTEGFIEMKKPKYLTKQKAFLQKGLRNHINHWWWIIVLVGFLEVYVIYKISRKLQKYILRKKSKESIEEQEQRTQEQGQFCNCVICYTNIRSIVLKPCRHYAFCQDCYQSFKNKGCPLCKKEITGIIKIIKKKD